MQRQTALIIQLYLCHTTLDELIELRLQVCFCSDLEIQVILNCFKYIKAHIIITDIDLCYYF
jgi:hypothetical protein